MSNYTVMCIKLIGPSIHAPLISRLSSKFIEELASGNQNTAMLIIGALG